MISYKVIDFQQISIKVTYPSFLILHALCSINYNCFTQDYQSKATVKEDSGIPLNLLDFFHSFGYDCQKRANLHLLGGPTVLFAAGNLVSIFVLNY